VQVDTTYLKTCDARLGSLASDVNPALRYTSTHLEGFSQWGDGRLAGAALGSHGTYLASTETNLAATKRLLSAAADALNTIALRYDATDDDQSVAFRNLFKDLDPNTATPPITAATSPSGGSTAEPSAGLSAPEAMPDLNPVFLAIMQWPDYLSFTWWARWLINQGFQLVWPGVGGGDVFQWLWSEVGGDWDRIYTAGSAFGQIGDYFSRLSDATRDEAVAMFQGWTEGEAATAAGEFFAEIVAAFEAQLAPYADLELKYQKAAASSYMLCQAAYSGLDALGDHVVAMALGVGSIGEAVAAFFSGGATAPMAIVSAVAAFIAELSAIWGSAVAAVMAIGGLMNGLQATSLTITSVPIPEA
jgi:hypothetical protein